MDLHHRINFRKARIGFPRLDFTAKLFLWGIFCVSVFLIAGIVAWLQEGNQGLQNTQHDMDGSLTGFQLRLDERSMDLEDLAKWLTGQPEFVKLVISGDSANLTPYLDRLIKANLADIVTVADSTGKVLAKVSKDQPSGSGESILAEPGIRAALTGEYTQGIAKDLFGNLVQSLVIPIPNGGQNPPIGVLRLGFYVDSGFLSRASTEASAPLSYYYADADTLTLLGNPQRKPFLTTPIPPAALKSLRDGRMSDFLTLETVEGPYLFKFSPFRSLDTNVMAAYGVGLPLTAVQAGHMGLLTGVEVTSLILAVFTCLVGYLLYRRYSLPLRTLGRSAQRMADGDFSGGGGVRDDDLDGLGGQINRMQVRLRESLQSITKESSRKGAIMQSLAFPFFVTDEGNHIVDANSSAESLLKQGKDDLLGRDWRDIFAETKRSNDGPGLFREVERTVSPAGGVASVLHGIYSLRRDPRIRLNVLSRPFGLEGRPAGYVHVLEDASEQEQFARARDEFMMNAAHELRSPLASLRTSVEALNEEQSVLSTQELGFMLRNMRRSVIRFEAFVENLIDMGNIMAGRFMVRPIPCLLNEIPRRRSRPSHTAP